MARTIAVSNQKGGVGKTTTVVNLGAGLARCGFRVLLVDVDMEGTLDVWLQVQPPATLYDVVVRSIAPADAVIPLRPNLDLLASGSDELKRHIFQLRDARAVPTLLTRALSPLQSAYHYILLDNGPGLDPLQIASFAAASEVIIPTTTQRLGIDGMVKQINTIGELQDAGYRLTVTALVPTMYQPQMREQQFWLAELQRQFPETTDPIRQDARLLELPRYGRTIFEHAPASRAAHDYALLTRRISDGS